MKKTSNLKALKHGILLLGFAVAMTGCQAPEGPRTANLMVSPGEFTEEGFVFPTGSFKATKVTKDGQVEEIVCERIGTGKKKWSEFHFKIPEGATEIGFKRRNYRIALTYRPPGGDRVLQNWFATEGMKTFVKRAGVELEGEWHLGSGGKWMTDYVRSPFRKAKAVIYSADFDE
jgi:hypothetical protein